MKAKKSNKLGKLSNILTLSDVLDGYKKIMKKRRVDTLNETHYYAMMVKLSLN
jgi:hypothetical protein